MRWSEEEVETLRELYTNTPNREIAVRLGRSQQSVEMKAKSLRLRKAPSPPPGPPPPSGPPYINGFAMITREEAVRRDKVELLRYSWSLTDMYRRELENQGLDDVSRHKVMNSMANMINVTNTIMRYTPEEAFQAEPDLGQRLRHVIAREAPVRGRRVRVDGRRLR